MNLHRLTLVAPPAIVRPALPGVDTVFFHWGRPLRIARLYGEDPAAPVIVEELADGWNGDIRYGKGQLSLWSLAGVTRVLANNRIAGR